MSSGKYWSEVEDGILLKRMELGKGKLKRRARRIAREGVLPGREPEAMVSRYYKLKHEAELEAEQKGEGLRSNRANRSKIVHWREEENQLLAERLKRYKDGNLLELADLLIAENAIQNHSREGIHERLCRIAKGQSVAACGYRRQWTPEQLGQVYAGLKAHQEMTMYQLAEKLVEEGLVGKHTARATESQISRFRRCPPEKGLYDEVEEEGDEGLALVPKKSEKFTVVKMMKVTASREDGSFYVKLVPQTIGEVYVGEPPGKDDIEAILVPQYGGGEYSVINQTTKKVHKRFKFDGPPKDPEAPEQAYSVDGAKYPLVKIMLVLNEVRQDPQLWARHFPKALSIAKEVHADREAARKEIQRLHFDLGDVREENEKMRPAYEAKKKQDEQKYDAELEDAAATLRSQQLVDRELKKVD